MKLIIVFLTVFVFVASGLTLQGNEEHMFQSAIVTSSQELYDLIEDHKNEVVLAAFYIQGDKHEKIVEDLEISFWPKHDIFDKIIYVAVDASDEYQFGGIL